MANAQMDKTLHFALFTLIAASCLQLLAMAKPVPKEHEGVGGLNETDCRCNSTNLTMMMDGHFLHKWLKFNTHHSIRHMSEAAGRLVGYTNHLQVKKFN